MREWLSRMNTGKVLFQKRAFCGVFLNVFLLSYGSEGLDFCGLPHPRFPGEKCEETTTTTVF